jgi:predicted transcriptional regulator
MFLLQVKRTIDPRDERLSRADAVTIAAALANEHRLHIVAVLTEGRQYVSELARQISMSRPLLHMHLRRLEEAGIVSSSLELSGDGKAMKYYEVEPFDFHLTPEFVAALDARSEESATSNAFSEEN